MPVQAPSGGRSRRKTLPDYAAGSSRSWSMSPVTYRIRAEHTASAVKSLSLIHIYILGADTRSIEGKAFGTMLLGLPEDPGDAAKALQYIRSQPNITVEEVENHA